MLEFFGSEKKFSCFLRLATNSCAVQCVPIHNTQVPKTFWGSILGLFYLSRGSVLFI